MKNQFYIKQLPESQLTETHNELLLLQNHPFKQLNRKPGHCRYPASLRFITTKNPSYSRQPDSPRYRKASRPHAQSNFTRITLIKGAASRGMTETHCPARR